MRTEYSTFWLETTVWSSHAEVNGCEDTSNGGLLGSAAAGVLCFFDDVPFFGCDATLPLVSNVPVMKTLSRS